MSYEGRWAADGGRRAWNNIISETGSFGMTVKAELTNMIYSYEKLYCMAGRENKKRINVRVARKEKE